MPSWYAIHTEPSCEWVARRALENLGLRVFLPWRWTRRMIAHRRCRIKAAYFPRYLFADLAPPAAGTGYHPTHPIRDILAARGVASLLGETPIPEKTMAALIAIATPTGEMPRPTLKPGDRVVYDPIGLEVTVIAVDLKHIRVLIPIFGAYRQASIPVLELEG
jgi:hypothetical protein